MAWLKIVKQLLSLQKTKLLSFTLLVLALVVIRFSSMRQLKQEEEVLALYRTVILREHWVLRLSQLSKRLSSQLCNIAVLTGAPAKNKLVKSTGINCYFKRESCHCNNFKTWGLSSNADWIQARTSHSRFPTAPINLNNLLRMKWMDSSNWQPTMQFKRKITKTLQLLFRRNIKSFVNTRLW